MKALITDGKNAGRLVRITESIEQDRFLESLNLDEIIEKDIGTGAFKMTEDDANWLTGMLREAIVKQTPNGRDIPDVETENYILGVMKRTAIDDVVWWNLRVTPKENADKPFKEWMPLGKWKTKKEALFNMKWEAEHDYK